MRKKYGFSLIELCIVLFILTIITSFTYPTYKQIITKSRRLDGKIALINLALRMDQYFSEHNTYLHATIANNKSTDILSSNLSPEGYYLLNIINQTNTTFKIQATPTGKQHDPQCASLIINQNGEQSTSVADANNKNNYKCWE